jgi:hypothetical protein
LLLLSALLLPAFCNAAENQTSAPANSAYLYVGWYLGQYPNFTDYISGYSVAADGSLTSLSGFPIDGPSFGLVSVRNFVFGDDGLNHIATYTRANDGSLRETSVVDEYQYAPQSQGMGTYALNPDRAGLSLNTVLSCGSCNSYVLPWEIGSDGRLSLVGGSGPPGGPAKWDGIFFFSPDNTYAYTDTWGGFETLRRNPDGSLDWLYGWPLPSPPPAQDPENQVCYPGDVASSSMGFVAMDWWGSQYWCGTYNTGYLMGTYTVGRNGYLELVPNTGFMPQVFEYSMAFDPTGNYLAIAGFTCCQSGDYAAALQIYKLQSNGTLTPVDDMQVVTATRAFVNVQWDNAGHVYASGEEIFGLHNLNVSPLYIYNFDGQNLTLAPGSPHVFNNVVGVAVAPQQ